VTLRELAIILNEGRKAADDIQDPGLSAALSAMTDAAVNLAVGTPIWDVDQEFAELVEKYT